jgi:hypothetical protein
VDPLNNIIVDRKPTNIRTLQEVIFPVSHHELGSEYIKKTNTLDA